MPRPAPNRGVPNRGVFTLGLAVVAAACLLAVAVHSELRGNAVAAPVGSHPGLQPNFQKGMVFGLFARSEPGHTDKGLAELKELGVDSVSIMIPWVIADVRALEMAPRADMTPSDESLAYTVRRAHGLGMRVFLMPFLYVDHMQGDEWRGTISPADWPRWFRNYGAFILHYAQLAGREHVEFFSVGSELCSAESRLDDWLALIKDVRGVYGGQVTYSANWDHRGSLGFSQSLDFLGMNAYFKLTDQDSPSDDDLVKAWKPIREEVEGWRRAAGKPIVITEVGYPSRRGAGTDPWNYSAEGAPDPEGQLRCYRAFERAWSGESYLQGVYFYMWWGEGGPADSGYTPRGKPAADVIRSWYNR